MFEKGELVTVRKKFWEIPPVFPLGIASEMRDYQGEIYRIAKTNSNGIKSRYQLETLGNQLISWTWDENWLEPATKIKDIDSLEVEELFNV